MTHDFECRGRSSSSLIVSWRDLWEASRIAIPLGLWLYAVLVILNA